MKSAAIALLLCSAAFAQTDDVDKLKAQIERDKKTLQDWPNLARYAADNAQLTKFRVVFMGDSITDGWIKRSPKFFSDNPGYIDRGISGQTTP